ncbi:hypothetical protein [Agrobacterium vitis]
MSFYTQMKKSSKSRAAVAEIQRIKVSIADGKLAERANLDAVTGEAREMLIAVNELLEASMQPMQKLGASIAGMSGEHDKGDIDVRLPSEVFKGDFAVMAKGINDMVDGHIAVKKRPWLASRNLGWAILKRRSSNSPARRLSSMRQSKPCVPISKA